MLQQDVLKRGIRSLAIIGLAKNVGKTTVLNGLVAEAEREAIPVGLVSIGVDGEERDVWSGRHKPPIHVPAGSLVATAGPLLDVGGGVWEVLDSTGVHSAVGEIFIARALQPTRVKLAGITAARAAARIDQQFRHFGAVLTLVDGAYDRKAAASPLVTEGAVCVVGASMARTLEEMVQKTEETVRLFTLPLCKDPVLRKAAQRAAAERKLVRCRWYPDRSPSLFIPFLKQEGAARGIEATVLDRSVHSRGFDRSWFDSSKRIGTPFSTDPG